MRTMRVCKALGMGFIMLAAVSCIHLGGHSDKVAAKAADPQLVAPAAGPAQREAQLRALIERYIQATSSNQNHVVRRRPYYLKQYSVYPGGLASAHITISDNDSRLIPYTASVKIDKQWFATHLHRSRSDAANDDNYLRDTGTETISYEWRGSQWVRTGSLFVANSSEERVNGHWQPRRPSEKRTVATEEERAKSSWFSRALSTITGGVF